jgi:hypothetical protein
MALPVEADHRTEHRQRVLKGASILNGITNSEISCMIRNMNKGGAELKVPLDSRVPQEFLLYVPTDGIAYQCVLAWRAGDRAGVTFNGTAPKPHWHYG